MANSERQTDPIRIAGEIPVAVIQGDAPAPPGTPGESDASARLAEVTRQRDVAIFDSFNQRTRDLRNEEAPSYRFEEVAAHMANIYNMPEAEVRRIVFGVGASQEPEGD
jgi:hypothetical protein